MFSIPLRPSVRDRRTLCDRDNRERDHETHIETDCNVGQRSELLGLVENAHVRQDDRDFDQGERDNVEDLIRPEDLEIVSCLLSFACQSRYLRAKVS